MTSQQKPLPTFRVIETAISRDTLVSIVDAWLQSVSIINDNENVVDITFGDTNLETVPIKIMFKHPQHVTVITH